MNTGYRLEPMRYMALANVPVPAVNVPGGVRR